MFDALEDEYKLEMPEDKDELTEEEKKTKTGRRLSRKMTLGQVRKYFVEFFKVKTMKKKLKGLEIQNGFVMKMSCCLHIFLRKSNCTCPILSACFTY